MTGSIQRTGQATRPSRFRRCLLPLLTLVLATAVLAGCAQRELESAADRSGDGSSSGNGAGNAAFPVTVTSPGNDQSITLESKPTEIVSLSPPATEVLYELGAGDQVAAVDDQSNYPQEAPRTKLSGLNPNPEAIAEYDPQLVVAHDDTDDLVAALDKLDIPTLILPAAETLDEAYAQYELLGTATGHQQKGAELAEQTRDEIDQIIRETPKPDDKLSYYHELGPDHFTATSDTFVGGVYQRFGLRNIADDVDDPAAAGYPQLSAQRVLQANPDLIFLADTKCCGMTKERVAGRPGWDTLNAVRAEQVIELNDDTASRWSPRIVEFVRAVSDAVKSAGNQE
ncbi:iron complex transport system substrate-binding protein [Tamaricihabitans halophyticus]|uniref:Iron complex transport system substrate-binding protein n=1 Tax=Tamaricihabitans halophyticus TaxID=1262583 RepID=A0A4R2QHT7_9PSEU|nr:ABC transporter substrate-binding protein [Tamaricihabitans halophyticus]TCP47938.1 iron complex transport system substrate-binding protein [Tamaricihabitans halophyticus]